jgi:hypothetical protein
MPQGGSATHKPHGDGVSDLDMRGGSPGGESAGAPTPMGEGRVTITPAASWVMADRQRSAITAKGISAA